MLGKVGGSSVDFHICHIEAWVCDVVSTWQGFPDTVGPRLSESRLSKPSIIRTVAVTLSIGVCSIRVFSKCMFY